MGEEAESFHFLLSDPVTVAIYIHLHGITQEASLHISFTFTRSTNQIMDLSSPCLLRYRISLSSLYNFGPYMSIPFILVPTLLDVLKCFHSFFHVWYHFYSSFTSVVLIVKCSGCVHANLLLEMRLRHCLLLFVCMLL